MPAAADHKVVHDSALLNAANASPDPSSPMRTQPAPSRSTFTSLGRKSQALEFLAAKQKKVPPKIGEIIGALVALLEGRQADAIAAITSIVSSGFRDAEGLYYLARQLAYAGAADDAVALLERPTSAGFWCYPLLASYE